MASLLDVAVCIQFIEVRSFHVDQSHFCAGPMTTLQSLRCPPRPPPTRLHLTLIIIFRSTTRLLIHYRTHEPFHLGRFNWQLDNVMADDGAADQSRLHDSQATRNTGPVQCSVFSEDYPVPSAVQNSVEARYRNSPEGAYREFTYLRCELGLLSRTQLHQCLLAFSYSK